jgi:myo-inositol 2-dehydrogenase / D-chiro-inositol 1-dehydrogenase
MKNKDIAKTRRNFLKNSGAAAIGSTVALNFIVPGTSLALNNDTLKVGLIGCGGRGTGAANQALSADDNVILTAMADIFPDRLEESLSNLKELHGEKVKVDKKHQFIGFDAYQKVLDSDVDVVLLVTPPVFRPMHMEKAVAAGKHIFCEKPMAVDAPGIRRAMEASKKAREKNLSLVSGFCWRFHSPKRETFSKILNGDIGQVHTVYNTYNTSELWSKPWQPEWTDMEKKMRNWLYYNWISGDHIVEQAIHSIDMGSWALNDRQPLSATATGGRQVRTEEIYGNIYDHFAVVFDYDDGVKSFHFSRQQKNCSRSYGVEMLGTNGRCVVDVIRRQHEIFGENPWRYRGEGNDMYQQEHDELFASIRNNKPIYNGDWMLQSNMMAILGRMAAYTGQTITYEEAWKSEESLGPDPEDYSWERVIAGYPVAKPGITKFS